MAKALAMISWNMAAGYSACQDPLVPLRMMTPFYISPVQHQVAAKKELLPDDLPEYLVYVTRNALLSVTTPLTKVFGETHEALARINHMLAFDRFMRAAVAWHTPIFPAAYSPLQLWQSPVRKPPALPLLPYWGTPSLPALPKSEIHRKTSQPAQTHVTTRQQPSYAAMMALPLAFLAIAPMAMDAWRLTI